MLGIARAIGVGKRVGTKSLSPSLYCVSTVLEGWLLHWITHESCYAIKEIKQSNQACIPLPFMLGWVKSFV